MEAPPEPAREGPPAERGRRLATFPRNRGDEELRVNLDEFEGHPYIVARIWFRTPDGWFPSKKGITIRKAELDLFISALIAGSEEIDQGGNVEPGRYQAPPRDSRASATPTDDRPAFDEY